MRPYYWPIGQKRDQEVRGRLLNRIKARHKRNWDTLEDVEWPLLKEPRGLEALAFYRSRDANWWIQEAMTFPDRARYHAYKYGALIRRYRPELVVAPRWGIAA